MALFLSFIISIVIFIVCIYFIISNNNQQEKFKFSFNYLDLLILLLFIVLFLILFNSLSFLAIASPWHFVPSYFWLILGLVLALLFYRSSDVSYFLLILLYLLFFSVSFFVYGIAFGYDQLLHQRAILEISNNFLIEPKTIYYIGQYVLELFILKIWPFSSELLSRLLVPALSALLIPLVFIVNFREKSVWPLILFLALPFSIFTYTVPQNLAFLFLLLLIIFSVNKDKRSFIFLFSLALSIFFIHPMAGIPALIFLAIIFFKSRIIKSFAYLAQIFSLPLSLLFIGGKFNFKFISISSWIPKFLGQEDIFLNFVYFFFVNKNIWLLFLFVIISIFVFKKKDKLLNCFYFNSLALLSSYFLSLFIDFSFLSQIDKSSYANRILIVSFLFLIPVFFSFFNSLVERIKQEKIAFRIISLLFLLLLLLSSLYLNYPRKDNYFNSRSFSVSAYDFEAVKFIENIKENDNYVVLANQQVGAAAIKEFGFKRYYGPWFYYSVQTGGLLYDYYLKMIDNPEKQLMNDLMLEIGADGLYLVLNDYWWAFDRIVDEMKIEADEYYIIGEGKIYIFYFN